MVHGLLLHHSPKDMKSNFYLLRRNTHRIEKGLLLRPRKNLFALSYIVDTVECFKRCAESVYCDGRVDDLSWSHDVISKYFKIAGDHALVKKARNIFDSVSFRSFDRGSRVPYHRIKKSTVTFEDFVKLSQQRRSVRWFLQKPVSRELIDKAVEMAAQAPCACNRQPFFFRFFDDPEIVAQLALLPMGTSGFHHNIPVICAVIGDLSAYFFERERHGIYVDASLAVMSFMYALETLGLSSCALDWPDFAPLERKAEKLLKLKKYNRIIMFIALGYPDSEGLVAFSQKKCLDQLRSYNMPDVTNP